MLIQDLSRLHVVTGLQCQCVFHLTRIWPFQHTECLLWFSSTDGVCSVVMETYEHLLPCDLGAMFRSRDSTRVLEVTRPAEEDHYMQLKVGENSLSGQSLFHRLIPYFPFIFMVAKFSCPVVLASFIKHLCVLCTSQYFYDWPNQGLKFRPELQYFSPACACIEFLNV